MWLNVNASLILTFCHFLSCTKLSSLGRFVPYWLWIWYFLRFWAYLFVIVSYFFIAEVTMIWKMKSFPVLDLLDKSLELIVTSQCSKNWMQDLFTEKLKVVYSNHCYKIVIFIFCLIDRTCLYLVCKYVWILVCEDQHLLFTTGICFIVFLQLWSTYFITISLGTIYQGTQRFHKIYFMMDGYLQSRFYRNSKEN